MRVKEDSTFYKNLYNKDYFNGKKSFFYKFGYRDFPEIWEKKLKVILKYKSKGRALDVGCAFGFFLKQLSKHFKVYGFDVSEYAIKIAKKNLPKVQLIVHDAEKRFPYPENFFDLITCVDVFEHLKFPKKLLRNIYICLKKDGILFLSTPNYNIIRKTIYLVPDKLEHHISMLPADVLIQNIKNSGFYIEKFWTSLGILDKILFSNNKYGPQSLLICRKK